MELLHLGPEHSQFKASGSGTRTYRQGGSILMQQISSRFIFIHKRIFPLFWFGFLAFFLVSVLLVRQRGGAPPPFFVLVPLFMGVFGFFMMKKMLWDLADQVWDAGSYLVVRFGSEEEQIPLSNITNISYSYMMSPPRVTLTLRTAGRFGNEVSFSPPISFVPFAKSPIVADLIQRVDAERQASR